MALTPDRLKRLRARRRQAAERTFPNRVDILRGRLTRDPDYGDEAEGQTVPPAVDKKIPARWRTSSVREKEMASKPQATAFLTLTLPAGKKDGSPLDIRQSDALLLHAKGQEPQRVLSVAQIVSKSDALLITVIATSR